eukprot:6005651-Pyramimonas_sp.AAC.1
MSSNSSTARVSEYSSARRSARPAATGTTFCIIPTIQPGTSMHAPHMEMKGATQGEMKGAQAETKGAHDWTKGSFRVYKGIPKPKEVVGEHRCRAEPVLH